MYDIPKSDFRAIELDADLLTTPFLLRTNWHVISGAPSCGKTTLINLLASKGFKTAPEGGRCCLEREIAKGRTIDEIRSDLVGLQHSIENTQLQIESGLPVDDPIFLDNALPTCLAWDRYFGVNPNELLRECFHFRYASVFILDPIPYQQNGLRYKDAALQSYLDEWHARDYCALGYQVTRVPALPPEERLRFVLGVLSKRGLI